MNSFVKLQLLSIVILLILIAISAAISYLTHHSFEDTLIGVVLGGVAVNLADTILKDEDDEDG